MKRIAVAVLAFALTPLAALAQDAPPPGPPPGPDAMGTPNPAMMSAMRATHEQMRQLHLQTRTAMLAGLTQQHRAAIASLVGQYAISPNPDPRVLEKQFDALLTRGESQNVINLAGSERTNERGMMQSARAQFESTMTPDQLSKMRERDQKMESMRAEHQQTMRTPDPGRELLHELLGTGEMRGRHEDGPPHQ